MHPLELELQEASEPTTLVVGMKHDSFARAAHAFHAEALLQPVMFPFLKEKCN